MTIHLDPLALFSQYHNLGAHPALLETPPPYTSEEHKTFLGTSFSKKLEVIDGQLYVNDKHKGAALDIFKHFDMASTSSFFPAWMGFFTYEFARYFGMATNERNVEGLPEAVFYLYDEGYVWNKGTLVEQPSSPSPFEKGGLRGIFSDYNINKSPQPPFSKGENFKSSFNKSDYMHAVEKIKNNIAAGNVYQVNLSRRLQLPRSIDPIALYQALRTQNPSPFMGLIGGADWTLVSGSPERLFALKDKELTARPIAGTRKRGKDSVEDKELEHELLSSEKERAEHAMLVDLARNDIARVSEAGSVHVREEFAIERYSHVMHLVSDVIGMANNNLQNIFASLFPGGTITGAPKERVMEEIALLEPIPRGTYTGALGYVSGSGIDFNILIRSATFIKDEIHYSSGAGIVYNSDAESEFLEVEQKAKGFLKALESCLLNDLPRLACPLGYDRGIQEVPRYGPRGQAAGNHRGGKHSILFIENHDSFSYNIVNYLSMLNANVTVIDHTIDPSSFPTHNHSHIVVGPGPGEPLTSGKTMQWIDYAITQKIPLLGICLGHQALGLYFGALLNRAKRPVHGEPHAIINNGRGLFAGLENPSKFARYHSLCLENVIAPLQVDAWTCENQVMAISSAEHRAYGVQFHPESFLSDEGLTLLENFLKL